MCNNLSNNYLSNNCLWLDNLFPQSIQIEDFDKISTNSNLFNNSIFNEEPSLVKEERKSSYLFVPSLGSENHLPSISQEELTKKENPLKRKRISKSEEKVQKKWKSSSQHFSFNMEKNESYSPALELRSLKTPKKAKEINQKKIRTAKINNKILTILNKNNKYIYIIDKKINDGSEGIIYDTITILGKNSKIIKELYYGISPLNQDSPEFQAIYTKEGIMIKPRGLMVPRKALCMNEHATIYEVYTEYECDLQQYIKMYSISNKLLAFIMEETLAGLTHCHNANCTWDDIKERNILTRQKNGQRQFVLGDPSIKGKNSVGSNNFMWTEGYLNRNDRQHLLRCSNDDLKWEIRKKMNVYSLGIVFTNIIKANNNKQISSELCKIINDMIHDDSTLRCSTADAYNRVSTYLKSNPKENFDGESSPMPNFLPSDSNSALNSSSFSLF